MKIFIFVVSFLAFFLQNLYADDQIIVINGLPMVQSIGTFVKSSNHQLSESKSNEYRLLIVKKGNNYYWTSRESKLLVLKTSGVFTYFIEPGGAGYIKITAAGNKFMYMEHMSSALQTWTYWGVSSSFNP
jgi:hypothetical protein